VTATASWKSASLGEVCRILSGGTPTTGVAEYWGGSIAWITPKDLSLDRSQTVYGGARSLTNEGLASSSATLFPPGAVVVSSRAPIGYVAIAGTEMAANQGCKIAVPPADLDSRYLYWFLLAAKPDLEARASGTTFKEVSGKEFARTLLRWPALREQRRIVDVLEDHLSRIEHASRSLADAEQRAASLSASSASRLISAGAGRACTEARFGGATVAIPAHWRMSTIGDEAVLVQYGSGAKTGPARDADDVPVLRMGNVKRGRVQLDSLKYLPRAHPDLERLLLDPGDLLFNRTNSAEHVGKSAVFKGASGTTSFASYLIRARLNSDVDPNWANLVINSSFGRAFVSSVVSQQVGQANVNGTKLKAFPLPVPPRAEQERLVAQHDEAVEAGLRVAAFVRDNLQRSVALRRSLLDAAFSGRL
jgi:type I restriction enzyme S subunit